MRREENEKRQHILEGQFAPQLLQRGNTSGNTSNVSMREEARNIRMQQQQDQKNKEAANNLISQLRGSKSEDKKTTKRKASNEEDDEPQDEVRLWEEGWKERYFRSKFDVSMQDYDFRRKVVESYVQIKVRRFNARLRI